jgi:hypothetical protein
MVASLTAADGTGWWKEVEAGPVPGSASARAAMRAVQAGVWSAAETDLLVALAGSSVLPLVWPNPVLETPDGRLLPSPDGWVDDVGLALQVHLRRYHARDSEWERTVEADAALVEQGVHVVAVTPTALRRDASRVRERAERAYAALVGRERHGRTW